MTAARSPFSDQDLIALAGERSGDLLATTQRLVRANSETPPSDTRAVAAIAAEALQAIDGVEVRTLTSEAPVTNVVARLAGGLGGKRLVLSGHLDTYPIGARADWTTDPLGGAIIDGRLYGRGSADMKGGCAALIGTVALFAQRMRPFPGEIVLALAGDEERMGELGTQWLIEHVPEVAGDGVIVADVGGPQSVRLGEKGMLWLDLVATGRQAHGAHVHAGTNAIDRLVDALTALRALEALPASPPAEAGAVMREAAARPGADGAAARRTMAKVSVNTGVIGGGTSANLVPAHAEASLDIRVPLGVTLAAVRAEVARCLRAHEGLRARETRAYEATWTAPDSEIAAAVLSAAGTVLARPAFFDMRVGGSDARLWRRAGFDTVVNGLSAQNLGAPDEHFAADELATLAAIHALAARRFLGA